MLPARKITIKKKDFSKRKRAVYLFVLLFIVVLFCLLIKYAGVWLTFDEPPLKSDAIIILSGDMGRINKGVELYKAGFANNIILSQSRGFGDYRDYANNHKVPLSSFINEDEATSTYENAVFTKEIMNNHNFKSAIVVSSDYHLKRARYAFQKVYKNSGITLTFSSSRYPEFPSEYKFNPYKWWTSSKSIFLTLNEYFKYLYYFVAH